MGNLVAFVLSQQNDQGNTHWIRSAATLFADEAGNIEADWCDRYCEMILVKKFEM